MSTTLSNVSIAAAITAALAGGAAPATVSGNVQHNCADTPTVGSSTGNVNKVYSAAFTVDTGTPLSLDLTSLVDPLGQTNNFGTVHAILIENLSIVAGRDFTVFGGTNGLVATSTTLIYAGTKPGFLLIDFGTTGIAVDGTHKIITIAVAAGTGIAGKITVVGK